MEARDVVNAMARWLHVFGGVLWIGFMMYFVIIMKPMMPTLDPPVRAGLMTALTPRMTKWMRGIVGVTVLTCLMLLGIVYHSGGLMFETGTTWSASSIILVVLAFAMFGPYDLVARSGAGRNGWILGSVALLVIMGMQYAMTDIAGMTYRAAMIHLGVMFAMILAANGFMRMIPAQRRMLEAMTAGKAPDPADVEQAQIRAEHNAYLALPVVWTMLNQHTVVPGASSSLWFLGILAFSTVVVSWTLRQTSK
ncbi:MAG: hypothetical protein A3C56_10595 [Ignavibacteria bacterium RIFCSPHIGHO2_02_FULL_56_12]|nr:MAG: hypothetical protein A3C56_10595 [Ignavibacteria bacterium RIFCSPHIGHO2_02_FULL_56_12]